VNTLIKSLLNKITNFAKEVNTQIRNSLSRKRKNNNILLFQISLQLKAMWNKKVKIINRYLFKMTFFSQIYLRFMIKKKRTFFQKKKKKLIWKLVMTSILKEIHSCPRGFLFLRVPREKMIFLTVKQKRLIILRK